MSGHGGSDPFSATAENGNDDNQRLHDDFRNIFGVAPKEDRFSGYGDKNRTRKLLEQLAVRMGKPYEWQGESVGNDNIPAGYTYLGQLAAHDMVHTASPLDTSRRRPNLRGDLRQFKLILDTVYGGGPQVTPVAYVPPERYETLRTLLRVGPFRRSRSTYVPEAAHLRDLPRVPCPYQHGQGNQGAPDVLVADTRNDDNVILAQLTALFHLLHNGVYRQLRTPDVVARFLQARKVVTLVYRRILTNDLLDRLLHPNIKSYYLPTDPSQRPANRLIDETDDNRLPLEFSHAVYRMGHVMVRAGYRLNQSSEPEGIKSIIRSTSSHGSERLPLKTDWLVQWSHFFKLRDEIEPNLSLRIDPSINISLHQNDLFPPEQREKGGLLFRDLLRGSDAGLRSVESLIALVKERLPNDVFDGSEFLQMSPDRRATLIREWLESGSAQAKFEPKGTEEISKDPPLLFFVLFEAATDCDGKRLGALGSVIVAEVFLAALDRTRALFEDDAETRELAEQILGSPMPDTMPKLIRHLAKMYGFEHDLNRFI